MPSSDDAAVAAARTAVVGHCLRLLADGLVEGSAGNISIRVGDKFVMSPSGMKYDKVTEEHVNVLSATGHVLDGKGRRSSEWPMHRRIYDISGTGAVVHTHSMVSVAIGTIADEIPAVHYAVLRLGGPTVRVAPYATFGSDKLAENVVAALEGRFAALMQNHGTVAYGRTVEEAYDRVSVLEWLAEVYWRARLAGTPRILSADELADITESARRRRYEAAGSS